MQITMVATLCHVIAGLTQPVCHKEIVAQADGGLALGCLIAEGEVVAEWKAHSIYRGDQWSVEAVQCVAGNYIIKETT